MTRLQPWKRGILLGLALGAGLATGATDTANAAPPPGIEVRFVPGDRFTDVGGSPLALLAGGSAPLDRQSLDRLAKGLALETWPEGQPVAGSVQVQALAPDWQRAQITFLPDAALRDRWYRLRADLPAGLAAAGDVIPAGGAGDGAWGVRFRTGSQLVVRRLRACREGRDLRLDLTFSERVRGKELRGAVNVSQGGDALQCAALAPTPPAPPAGESKDMDPGAGEIAFHCAGPSAAVPIDVTLGGLTAGGPEEALAYRLPSLQEWQTAGGCFWLAPTGHTASGQAFDAGMEVAP